MQDSSQEEKQHETWCYRKKRKRKRKKIASCCAGERARLSSSDALLRPCPSIPEDVCRVHHPSPAHRFQFRSWTLRVPSMKYFHLPFSNSPCPSPSTTPHEPPVPFWWKGCHPTCGAGAHPRSKLGQTQGGPSRGTAPPSVALQDPHLDALDQAHQLHLHRRRCCSRGTQMTSRKTKGKAPTVKDLTALLVIPTREDKTNTKPT